MYVHASLHVDRCMYGPAQPVVETVEGRHSEVECEAKMINIFKHFLKENAIKLNLLKFRYELDTF